MMMENFILYIIVFLYGIVIGSFLNVCIYRMPKEESIVTVGSHCMSCNHKLRWVDLFPLFSWLFLKGKCRYCGAKISVQYPLVEAANGILYVILFAICGWNLDSVIWCILTSVLLVIAVIDFRNMKFPSVLDGVVLVVGIIHLLLHKEQWMYYVAGFLFMGLFLLLCALLFKKITGKAGLGYGDIELMACAGLCIGWGHALLALILACLLGCVIQGIIMAVTKKGGRFPLVPYLATGIYVVILWGDTLLNWYVQTFIY
ncbi:MAG: prepilin peptidase [Eubacterium sp.]|nr:prepilin peptidase [Eubacterium sp.]